VRTVATSRNFSQGTCSRPSNNLDVAIQGNGFFQVTMPDGTIGYTRDGSFQVDNQGRWSPPTACRVANGITIPANAKNVTISNDGTVIGHVPGNTTPQNIGTIALAASSTRPAWSRRARTCCRKPGIGPAPTGTPGTNGLGMLMQGFLETSNVNVVQELVTMIQTQRAYEMNSKAIQTSDQMLQKLASCERLRMTRLPPAG
jgi:flagellar basal-body rod protein FlgG